MAEPVRTVAPAAAETPPMTSEALAGRRLIVLLFDTSSMQPEDVQRAVDSARKFVKDQMNAADLVAVATVASTLDVLTDFSGERERIDAALGRLAYSEGTATEAAAASTTATEEAAAAAEEPASTEASELDMFNNDVRLRALRTLADTLSPIEQKKAIVYFSAGMQRSGQDNLVELRAAVNASVRAHVAMYPIEVRGLQAVVPGGDARQPAGAARMFSTWNGAAESSSLVSDTLTSLAARPAGGLHDASFGEAFTVQRGQSAYYLMDTAAKPPGRRFRRVQCGQA